MPELNDEKGKPFLPIKFLYGRNGFLLKSFNQIGYIQPF